MSKNIRIYNQKLGAINPVIRIVVTSNSKLAWSTEVQLSVSTTTPQTPKIKQMQLSKFQEEVLVSAWDVSSDRCEIGSMSEKEFLALLAALWSKGGDLAATGILPALDAQKPVAQSLLSACKEFSIAISDANKDLLSKWERSDGVWRKASGCWF